MASACQRYQVSIDQWDEAHIQRVHLFVPALDVSSELGDGFDKFTLTGLDRFQSPIQVDEDGATPSFSTSDALGKQNLELTPCRHR